MSKGLQELINTKVIVPPEFAISREPFGNRGVVVAVRGELDMLTVPELRTILNDVVEGGASRVVLDFSEVSFIDSVSLAAIVNARRRLGAGGRLGVVIEDGSYAMLIFEIGGLDSIVELFPTRELALAKLGT